MGYTERQDARSHDSVTTFDSTTLSPGVYTASATLGCNDELVAILSAVKGAGAWVQGAATASVSGGSNTPSLAFGSGNTLGNCIIVDASMSGLFGPVGTTAVCADTQGNTYTQIHTAAVGGGNLCAFSFVAFNVAAGANTVTVTFTPGFSDPPGPVTLAINEYARGSSLDTSAAVAGASASTYNLSLTTTAGAELLHLGIFIAAACGGSPSNVTGGNPLTPPTPPQAWLIVNEPSLSFTDRSSYLYADGSQHSFDLKLRERGTANYTLVSDPSNPAPARQGAPSGYLPTMGQPIYLYDQNMAGYTLVFAGLIQDFTERWVGVSGLRYIDCTAVSLESVFDTVYVEQAMLFVNQTCGAILTALFNAFENGCPVSLGLIQDGATIPQFNANPTDKLSDLFDQLATTSQFTWGVDPQTQQLFFQLPTATPAPFVITSSNVLWDSISQKFDNADYRNRQAVKLSFDAFSHSEEYFVGAGTTGPFTLMRPLQQGVAAYITTATPNTATASFSGQPSPGDTITIGPADGVWQGPSHIYALGGYIVVNGFVFQVTTAGTSGLTEPNFAAFPVLGDTVGDNSVIWTNRGTNALGAIFTSYEFVTALDNTQFGQILIGATLGATVQNTVDALNAAAPYNGTPATQGRGLTFSLPTWENSQVNAITVTGTGFTVTQKIPGSGNVAGLTASSTHFAWSAANTSGGTSPQTSVGLNEGAWISIAIYAAGTSTSAPGLIYKEGSAVVTLATPLNVGTNLVVEYTRTDGNIIEVENTASVAALAAISHGTGKYQQATDQSSTGLVSTDAGSGLQFAQQILATFDVTQQKFDLDFYRPGIFPGQVVTLNLNSPLDVMNGSYLALSIKGQMVYAFPYLDDGITGAGHYRYTVELINVNLIGTDLAFWLGLGGGGSGAGSGTAGALVATSGSTGQTTGTGLVVGGVNAQTTSYTAVSDDNGKIISFNDASAATLTLPAAPPFAQWNIFVENVGAGTLTVSPNGLDIDGSASSLTLATNSGLYISTDGTNYFTQRGDGSATPGGSNPQVQYNNAGVFGGITGATSNGTSLLVTTQTQHDNSTKAASTAYTDLAVANAIAGVNPAVAVQAATTAAGDTSGLTYNNGASGIGATFTGIANTGLTIDGFTFTTVGQRLLVKNDTQSPSGAFNGIYNVTQIQTLLLPPILTRALDYDQPSDINNTGAIPVQFGTANVATSWLLTSQVVTVGTTPLTYIQFSANPATLLTNPMTTQGDIIYGGVSGAPTRLAAGTSGNVLQTNGSSAAPTWVTPSGGGGGMTLIASSVLASPAATVTFSSIPATYKNLQVVIIGRSATSANNDTVYMQFNGDTAAHYTTQIIVGSGGSASAAAVGAAAQASYGQIAAASSSANVPGIMYCDIPGYALTTFYKAVNIRNSSGGGTTSFIWGGTVIWETTPAAINAIVIALSSAANFVTGSAFYLYGY